MRYGILLLTLFILSDSFSFVFAQRKFKGKSTNISPGRWDLDSKKSIDTYSETSMDTYSDKSSVISGGYQKIAPPQRLDSGIYQAHILQILKKLPFQLLQ